MDAVKAGLALVPVVFQSVPGPSKVCQILAPALQKRIPKWLQVELLERQQQSSPLRSRFHVELWAPFWGCSYGQGSELWAPVLKVVQNGIRMDLVGLRTRGPY